MSRAKQQSDELGQVELENRSALAGCRNYGGKAAYVNIREEVTLAFCSQTKKLRFIGDTCFL